MRKEDGYYIDERNNRWTSSVYTEEQAIEAADTLVDCYSCLNCTNCTNCTDCSYCGNLTGCHNCLSCHDCSDCANCSYCGNLTGCHNCLSCHDCTDCNSCLYCGNCTDCNYCIDCHNCHHCTVCRVCRNYPENPQRYTHRAIGSRNDSPSASWTTDKDVQCVVGCFRGNLDELEARVKEVYPEGKHHDDYMEFIEICRYLTAKGKGVDHE